MATQKIRTAMAFGAAVAVICAVTPSAQAEGAIAITGHERGVDVNPGSQNPCTLALGTVIDVNVIHFHITTLADGTVEESGHDTAEVTFIPDDSSQPSYQGHETYASHQTGNSGTHTTTTTFHVRMKGTDGSWLDVRETAHLTWTVNGPTASFDRPTLTCS